MESSGSRHCTLAGDVGRRLRQDDSDVGIFFKSGRAEVVQLEISGSVASFRSVEVMVFVFISTKCSLNLFHPRSQLEECKLGA